MQSSVIAFFNFARIDHYFKVFNRDSGEVLRLAIADLYKAEVCMTTLQVRRQLTQVSTPWPMTT